MTTEQPAFFEQQPFPATTPLPHPEPPVFDDMPFLDPASTVTPRIEKNKSVERLNPSWQTVADAVASHCRECVGYEPTEKAECGGGTVHDGKPCRLHETNSRRKRERLAAPELLKAIQGECRLCTGGRPETCTSPACSLYPFRAADSSNGEQTVDRLKGHNRSLVTPK